MDYFRAILACSMQKPDGKSFSHTFFTPNGRKSSAGLLVAAGLNILPLSCKSSFSTSLSGQRKSGEESTETLPPAEMPPSEPKTDTIGTACCPFLPDLRRRRPESPHSTSLTVSVHRCNPPQCLCPDTGVELLTARSSENCIVSLRSRAVHSSFCDRSPSRPLRSLLRPWMSTGDVLCTDPNTQTARACARAGDPAGPPYWYRGRPAAKGPKKGCRSPP